MNRWAILGISLTLAGCVQVGPKALFADRGADSAVGAAAPRNPCALPELPPIAETVSLAIAPGRPVRADAGGRALVIGYGKARAAIRACREGR